MHDRSEFEFTCPNYVVPKTSFQDCFSDHTDQKKSENTINDTGMTTVFVPMKRPNHQTSCPMPVAPQAHASAGFDSTSRPLVASCMISLRLQEVDRRALSVDIDEILANPVETQVGLRLEH